MSVEAWAATISVQGHRGARARRPENTLAAFDYALQVGVDVLELDLAVSKDNKIVVRHDPFVTPELCLGADGKPLKEAIPFRSLDLATIKTYDCGSLRHPEFPEQKLVPGEKIPTLAEVFELVQKSKAPAARTVAFNIETKLSPSRPELAPGPEEFARLLVDVVRQYGMVKRTTVQSFDHRSLVAVRKLEPQLSLSPLFSQNLPDLVLVAKGLQASQVSPNKDWINAEVVKALHAAHIKVVPWTANAKKDWDRLLDLGVDGIITDDPKALLQYLQKRG